MNSISSSIKELETISIFDDYLTLDPKPEQEFDNITNLVAQICETPVAAVSIVDRDRVWFKSKFGFDLSEIDIQNGFSSEAVKQKDLYIVSLDKEDKGFKNCANTNYKKNEYCFYAGFPLVNSNGVVFGTLCVLDTRHRELNEVQKNSLKVLARQVEAQFELRYKVQTLEMMVEKTQNYSEKVLQTQERYRSVVDNLKEVIFQTDADGCWIFLNPAWTEITGFTVDESLGELFLNFVHPHDRELNAIRFEPLIKREKEYCRHEIRYLTKDNNFRWMEVFARLTLNMKGEIVGTSGTLNDITERKFAEEALKKETFYVNLLQTATDAANEGKSVDESMQICLDKICELMDWSLGHVYSVTNKIKPQIKSTNIWSVKDAEKYSKFISETQNPILDLEKELPGQVLESKKTVWSCHLGYEPFFSRRELVRELGLKSGFAFPVMAGSKVIAILEFFTSKLTAPDEKFLEVMQHIGIQLGRIIERKRAEENLRQSEERFRAISETSPLGIFLTDSEGSCIYLNKTLELISGFAPEEFLGFNWMQSVHSDDLKQLYYDWESKGKIGEYNFVYRLIRKDGLIIWANAHSAPIKVNDKILGYVGMVENITERKNIERGLRDSEERYRDLFENANDLIQSVGIDGKFVYVNPAWRHKLGYTEKEVKNLSIWDVIHPDCEPHCRELFQDTMTGKSVGMIETIFSAKDGRAINVEGTINIKRKNGKPLASLAIFRDVTDRKTMELALRESEERYRIVAESANDAIITVDGSGKILFVNSAAERIFGYSKEEIISQNLTILMPGSLRSGRLGAFNKFVVNSVRKMPWKGVEFPARHKDGRKIFVEISFGEYLRNEEHFFTGIIRDVTERKKIAAELQQAKEDAEAATQAKSEFLANMSHEIRTPMNSIIGLTGLLLENKMPAEQKDILETISHSAEALLSIINDILDFSKIEAGKLSLEIIDFDLSKTITEVYNLFAEQSLKGNNKLKFQITPEISKTMYGDPFRLRQVLTNMVGNAVKFTKNGTVEIMAEVKEETENDFLILFKVKDDGIGIAPEDCKRLFTAFSQADGSITRRFGGTGLGLAISKQLVKLMNGEIGFESELGKGSTFWFTARFNKIIKDKTHPFNKEPFDLGIAKPRYGNKTETRSKISENSQIENSKLKILVADDNKVNQKVALLMLKSLGYIADVVNNGKEALDALQKQNYDIVLMDVQMPEMDGMEVTRYVRREQNPQINPYIIAMTANAMRGDREACLNAGMNDYLSKPIRKDQLQRALEKCSLENMMPDQTKVTDSIDFTILNALKELSGDSDQLIIELIQMFIEDVPEHLNNLKQSYSAKEFEKLKGSAHALKGSCASLGAVKMASFCAAIEDSIQFDSTSEIDDLIKRIEVEFKQILTILTKKYDISINQL
ncbi:MAG: PAS domain S-box protein [Pyrinomonadaceae bacterium]|nr:PAS domain S-box protein [Pyrinomonadaceae bacterium]